MVWTKGQSVVEVAWSAAGTTSDPVVLEVGVVPARLEVPSGFTGGSVQLQVRGRDGLWRTLTWQGMAYDVAVSPSTTAVLDAQAVWALAEGPELRLVSSASEAAGTTATLYVQARGL